MMFLLELQNFGFCNDPDNATCEITVTNIYQIIWILYYKKDMYIAIPMLIFDLRALNGFHSAHLPVKFFLNSRALIKE